MSVEDGTFRTPVLLNPERKANGEGYVPLAARGKQERSLGAAKGESPEQQHAGPA